MAHLVSYVKTFLHLFPNFAFTLSIGLCWFPLTAFFASMLVWYNSKLSEFTWSKRIDSLLSSGAQVENNTYDGIIA